MHVQQRYITNPKFGTAIREEQSVRCLVSLLKAPVGRNLAVSEGRRFQAIWTSYGSHLHCPNDSCRISTIQ
eukprot:2186173-Amphidinium_carterae.1